MKRTVCLLVAILMTSPAYGRRRPVKRPRLDPPVAIFTGETLGRPDDPSFDFGLPAKSYTIEMQVRVERIDPEFPPSPVILLMPTGASVYIGIAADGKLYANDANGGIVAEASLTGRWAHIALRSSESSFTLLVDGAPVASREASPAAIPSATILIGEYLHGAMRQLRFWKVPLSDQELKRYAMTTPDAGDSRLAAWWPMDDSLRQGFSTYFVEDFGPSGFDIHNYPLSIRWGRQEVIEAGPFLEYRKVNPSDWPGRPLFVDFDHDGDQDLYYVQGFPPPQISHYPYYTGEPPEPDLAFRNDGSGQFAEVSNQVLAGPRVQGCLVAGLFPGDFTGDGLEDIFVLDAGPEIEGAVFWPESIRVGTAQGTLVNESATRIGVHNTYDHRSAAGDIDGDGDIDLMTAGNYIKDPSGYFPPDPAAPDQSDYGSTVAYLNDGNGVFTIDGRRVPLNFFLFTSIALIDVDLDGDLDAVLGDNQDQRHNVIALNDGTGHFALAPSEWFPRHVEFPSHDCPSAPYPCRQAVEIVEPADMNNDGILDLVVLDVDAYYPSEQGIPVDERRAARQAVQLLLGNGDGTFRDESVRIPVTWEQPPRIGGVELGSYDGGLAHSKTLDQNGDGWRDVIVNSNGLLPSALFLNRGSASLEEAGDLLGIPHGSLFAIGDIDGDGDDDIATEAGVLENLKPWKPNAFPRTDLQLHMTVSTGTPLVQTVTVTNSGADRAPNASVAIPVPHGYQWESTNASGSECTREGHVVLCSRSALDPGTSWQIIVRSNPRSGATFVATHAVASVTADIFENDLSDNVSRVPFSAQ